MGIDPKKLYGNWDEGWALDIHTISSTYIGDNAYGRPMFDTDRTELGQQLFLLKNRGRTDTVDKIMDLISDFLDNWDILDDVDVVIPAPPTDKDRIHQPVYLIASAVADYIGKSYVEDVLLKTTNEQSKNMDGGTKKDLTGSIVANLKSTSEHNVLLVDDLYQTGGTLNECVRVLREDENVNKIYVLAITKTRR